jgi:hypothetical protein
VLKHRDFYGAYHHHKETMAYSATALFLGGMSTFIVSDFWHQWPRDHKVALAAGIMVTTALTLGFVLWQFQQRLIGSDMVAACTDLTADWITAPPIETDLQALELDGHRWPAALTTRFRQRRQRGLWLPRDLSILAVLFWSGAAIVKIVVECKA